MNTKFSDLQQQVEQMQERVDAKSQKYKQVKAQLNQVMTESQDRDLGRVRLEEELQTLKKKVEEAEARAKKFESRYRQAVREAEDAREQLSSM
jgi:phage shock protein A